MQGFVDQKSQGLRSLPNLPLNSRSVSLSNNEIKELRIEDFENQSWSSVRILNLDNNGLISYGGLNGFHKLSKLKVLDLCNNALTTLDINAPRSLNQIKVNNNELNSIKNIDDLINLETLEIANNHINIHSFQSNLSHLKHLTLVDISNNHLESFDILAEIFPRCIEIMYLSGNPVQNLTNLRPLSAFRQLKALRLQNLPCVNKLIDISGGNHSYDLRIIASYLLFLVPSIVMLDDTPISSGEKSSAEILFKKQSNGNGNNGNYQGQGLDEEALLLLLPENESSLISYLLQCCNINASRSGSGSTSKSDNKHKQSNNIESNVDTNKTKTKSMSLADIMASKNSINSSNVDSNNVITSAPFAPSSSTHLPPPPKQSNNPGYSNGSFNTVVDLNKVVAVQAWWRGQQVREQLNELQMATSAAVTIQAGVRRLIVQKRISPEKTLAFDRDYDTTAFTAPSATLPLSGIDLYAESVAAAEEAISLPASVGIGDATSSDASSNLMQAMASMRASMAGTGTGTETEIIEIDGGKTIQSAGSKTTESGTDVLNGADIVPNSVDSSMNTNTNANNTISTIGTHTTAAASNVAVIDALHSRVISLEATMVSQSAEIASLRMTVLEQNKTLAILQDQILNNGVDAASTSSNGGPDTVSSIDSAALQEDTEKLKLAMKYLWTEVARLRGKVMNETPTSSAAVATSATPPQVQGLNN